jgi:hypothetical protein
MLVGGNSRTVSAAAAAKIEEINRALPAGIVSALRRGRTTGPWLPPASRADRGMTVSPPLPPWQLVQPRCWKIGTRSLP